MMQLTTITYVLTGKRNKTPQSTLTNTCHNRLDAIVCVASLELQGYKVTSEKITETIENVTVQLSAAAGTAL